MYERKRIRRPSAHTEPFALTSHQAAYGPDVAAAAASAVNPGHNFGRIAVTSPTASEHREVRHTLIQPFAVSIPRATPAANIQGDQKRPDDLDVTMPEPDNDETETPPAETVEMGHGPTGSSRVRGALAFTANLTDEATNPPGGEFGATTFTAQPLQDRQVTAGKHAFSVTATEELDITVKVCPGNGPHHEINIAGDSDPAIDSGNYLKVAADLTPNSNDHVPPRNHYWARDLVRRHEHFHAAEDERFGKEGTKQAQAVLNKRTAKTEKDVHALLDQVPGEVENHIRVNMAWPGREQRAYADGAAEYQARADAIKQKGDSGKYPPPSP